MKTIIHIAVLLIIAFLSIRATGKQLTQTIRGSIADKVSQTPLPGATVIVLGSDPIK